MLAVACGEASSGADSGAVAEAAARGAVRVWAVRHGLHLGTLDVTTVDIFDSRATVRVTATVRPSRSADWETLDLIVPVSRNAENGWTVPSTAVIDRLVVASRTASALENAPALTPTPASTITPTPIPPTATPEPLRTPPPPAGDIVYESDWSGGMDGWIGTPDWEVAGGYLVNDGTRASREPWLEAPVQVEPWQAMIVEVVIEVQGTEYGSFGLVARGGQAGWLQLGMRWQEVERDNGSSAVTLGATIRRSTQRVQEEWFTHPHPLTPGPHVYRFEFIDGAVSMLIDGVEVGEIEDHTFAMGAFIGLWSERTPLEVGFFRVTLV